MKLVIQVSGSMTGPVTVELKTRCLQLGRGETADIQFEDLSCSRLHAVIFLSQDRKIMLRDLRSTNGVQVNSKKIELTELKRGDYIKIGNSGFRLLEVLNDLGVPVAFEVVQTWPSKLNCLPKTFQGDFLKFQNANGSQD